MTITEMINKYHKHSATDNYIIVAESKKEKVVKFAMYHMNDLINFNCFTTTTSSKGENMLRLLVSTELKKSVLAIGETLATYDEKEQVKEQLKLNNGETSEYLVTTYFNQIYKRDNIPFYEKGDININGIEYQIKSHKAMFATEKQLNTLDRTV